jgi:hypothetical protein
MKEMIGAIGLLLSATHANAADSYHDVFHEEQSLQLGRTRGVRRMATGRTHLKAVILRSSSAPNRS